MSNGNHQGLGSRIHSLFAADGGVELDLPDRRDLPADQQRRAQISASPYPCHDPPARPPPQKADRGGPPS